MMGCNVCLMCVHTCLNVCPSWACLLLGLVLTLIVIVVSPHDEISKFIHSVKPLGDGRAMQPLSGLGYLS